MLLSVMDGHLRFFTCTVEVCSEEVQQWIHWAVHSTHFLTLLSMLFELKLPQALTPLF